MIDQKRHIQKLKSTFYGVFKNRDPFGSMFNDHIKQKIILCPTDGYYLDEKQFNALIKTIQQINEISFYLSEVDYADSIESLDVQKIHSSGHWELNNETSYEDYRKHRIMLENALYSPNGTWGLIISHEDHAVLGGSEKFMQLFKQSYLEWEQGLKYFVMMWEYNKKHYKSDLSWVPRFLNYINQT